MLITLKELKEKFGVAPKSVLHIGASHGEERDSYRDNGVERVVWIEAIQGIYEKLKENIKGYGGHTAINACVHEVAGLDVEFNISSNDGQSSSIFEFGTHSKVHPDVTFIYKTTLKTTTVERLALGAFDMINLDIQGAELLALKGCGNTLKDVKYIYTEVNVKELYVGCVLLPELDAYLKGFGFKRVLTRMAGRTGWGDAFYLKAND